MSDNLLQVLQSSELKQEVLENALVPHLVSIGVKSVDDFEYIKEEDLSNITGTCT